VTIPRPHAWGAGRRQRREALRDPLGYERLPARDLATYARCGVDPLEPLELPPAGLRRRALMWSIVRRRDDADDLAVTLEPLARRQRLTLLALAGAGAGALESADRAAIAPLLRPPAATPAALRAP
jgi:hypothetical protein